VPLSGTLLILTDIIHMLHIFAIISCLLYPAAFATSLKQFIAKLEETHQVSIHVQQLTPSAAPKLLLAHHANQPKHLASVQKLFTTVAALEILGPDYQFPTRLYKKGTEPWTITTSGDPTLTSDNLKWLLQPLANTTLNKPLQITANRFDGEIRPAGTLLEEQLDCYNAPVSSLNLDQNCETIFITQQNKKIDVLNAGDSPYHWSHRIQPQRDCGDNNQPQRIHYSIERVDALMQAHWLNNQPRLTGCINPSLTKLAANFAIILPQKHFTNIVKQQLKQQHTILKHPITVISYPWSPGKTPLIREHYSAPVSTLIRTCLKESDNLIANSLFKALSQNGSWQGSTLAVKEVLAKSMNTDHLDIIDGAGLSRNNRIRVSDVGTLLNHIYQKPQLREHIMSSLPIAGEDGTLYRRFKQNTQTIIAKTGTLKGISTLAGYIQPDDPHPIAFVISLHGDKDTFKQLKQIEAELIDMISQLGMPAKSTHQ